MTTQEKFDKKFESLPEDKLPSFLKKHKNSKFLSEKHFKLAAEKITDGEILIWVMYDWYFENKLNI